MLASEIAVNLANNHIFDFGKNEVYSTLQILEENGIEYFGINNKVLVLEEEKVVLTGFCCYSTNAFGYLTDRKKFGVNILDSSSFKTKLENLNNRNYESKSNN